MEQTERMNIGKYLNKHGVKASYQRIRILNFLMDNDTHPTVNDIYHALITEIPTLSKTTVYNTLNLFVEHELVNTVLIEDNEIRYDWKKGFHGHFKCTTCDRLYDVEIDIAKENLKGLDGFKTSEQHFYFKGICSSCQIRSNNSH